MPNYAPLPPIELDPRNESELVAAAAQRVYEASGATINDFSSGSPIMALLEGQAFAQAELLAFANSFPEAVLVEWIGPFLGAQRRTGAGSVVDLTFEVFPRSQDFVIFAGFEVSTDPNLTGGESISFVTTELLRIPPNETTGKVQAIAVLKGVRGNVPKNSVVRPVTSLAGVLGVTNEEAAVGGQDVELLSEVKERFFTLIRRRNPVSAEDWVDFFSDALGAGTSVNVLPRRSEKDAFRYTEDFVSGTPSVAFFVLNPDGTPLTSGQRRALQNLLRFSLPTEFTGTVYSMEVDDVDMSLTLEYDPNKPYAADLREFTRTVRDNLFGILTPNAVFPVSYEPNVSDVEGALATSFSLTLGTNTQYIDPDIASLAAYHSPRTIAVSEFEVTEPQPFETGSVLKAGDLVVNSTGTLPVFFNVEQDFSPVTGTKSYHANIGDLDFRIIRNLEVGEYRTGDVVANLNDQDTTLHVVKADFTYSGRRTPSTLILDGLLSEAKTFSDYVVGEEITALNGSGAYDPQIVAFARGDLNTEVFEPRTPTSVPLNRRPGYPVWVAKRNFSPLSDLTDLGTAQNEGFIGTRRIQIELISQGESYSSGEFLSTPDPEQILTGVISEDVCYADRLTGFRKVYLEVLTDFTFAKREEQTFREAVDLLVQAGLVKVVQVVEYLDCAARPLFANKQFRYKSRFALGEYVRFRSRGGFDSSALEDCFLQASECGNVTSSCKRLLESNLPLPRYFQALTDFTPVTTDVEAMVEEGLIVEVEPSVFRYDYTVYAGSSTRVISADFLTSILVEGGQIERPGDLITGETLRVLGPAGENYGTYFWNSQRWVEERGGIPTFREMFRFAPGDAAAFRNGSSVRVYEATEHVTPLMNLETYFDNGVFVRSDRAENVRYYDPSYRYEDVILDTTTYSQKFYRVTRSFTPPDTENTWAGLQPNSVRIQEVFGNLLKFTVKAEGTERIISRLGPSISTSKLGITNLRVISKANEKASYNYVWESTPTSTSPLELSYSPDKTQFKPVNYGEGTLAL
jgi:hypothetical protein